MPSKGLHTYDIGLATWNVILSQSLSAEYLTVPSIVAENEPHLLLANP